MPIAAWNTIIWVMSGLAILIIFLLMKKNWGLKSNGIIANENNKITSTELSIQLQNISNEIKTPLSLIISPLYNLLIHESETLSENVLKKIKIAHNSATQLLKLTNDLSDIDKLYHNEYPLNLSQNNIIELIDKLIGEFENISIYKNVYFNYEPDIKSPDLIFDAGVVEKIIVNLLTHAFNIVPTGSKIDIRLQYCNEPGSIFNMTSENKPTQFNYFAIGIMVSNTHVNETVMPDQTNSIQNKSAITLFDFERNSIVWMLTQQLILHHQGIFSSTQTPLGTIVFQVLIPIKLATHNSQYEPQIKSGILGNAVQINKPSNNEGESIVVKDEKIRILLVEDNVDLRKYLKDELSKNYRILEAQNGLEGWNMAVNQLPDLIISDVIMPLMDGFSFCRKLKEDFKTSDIPVILLTAKDAMEDHINGAKSGADAYLQKPFNLQLLKARIAQLLESRMLLFEKFLKNTNLSAEILSINSLDKDFLQSALNYIRNNLSNPDLNVESLADELASSRSQVYRKIKSLTGQSANEIIRKIRLNTAIKLMLTEGLNINEICYQVGFSSPSYFTKCFKEEFGMSPSAYLKDQISVVHQNKQNIATDLS